MQLRIGINSPPYLCMYVHHRLSTSYTSLIPLPFSSSNETDARRKRRARINRAWTSSRSSSSGPQRGWKREPPGESRRPGLKSGSPQAPPGSQWASPVQGSVPGGATHVRQRGLQVHVHADVLRWPHVSSRLVPTWTTAFHHIEQAPPPHAYPSQRAQRAHQLHAALLPRLRASSPTTTDEPQLYAYMASPSTPAREQASFINSEDTGGMDWSLRSGEAVSSQYLPPGCML